MQVVIGSTDITQYIQEKTYNINAVEDSITWMDSNRTEHYDAIFSKIQGSFQMVFFDGYSQNNTTVDSFGDLLTLIQNNTSRGILTIGLTVNNLNNEFKTITCKCDVICEPMRYTKNDSNVIVKRVTLNIRENTSDKL